MVVFWEGLSGTLCSAAVRWVVEGAFTCDACRFGKCSAGYEVDRAALLVGSAGSVVKAVRCGECSVA